MEVVFSSRRVKKGPGRRALSTKREEFMERRERGWGIRAAAREVGVSRSPGAAGRRLHDLPQGAGDRVRPALGPVTGVADQRPVLIPRTRASRSPIFAAPGGGASDPRCYSGSRRRRSRGSCDATPRLDAGIGPLMRTGGRLPVVSVLLNTLSTPPWCCARSWSNFWGSGGVSSKSAVTCGCVSRISPGCGSTTRASTRRSTSQVASF
jgi:hypothetical protein